MPNEVPSQLPTIPRLWRTVAALEALIWLFFNPGCLSLAIKNGIVEDDSNVVQTIAFIALLSFNFASRLLSLLRNATLDIWLLIAEIVGALIFTVLSVAAWDVNLRDMNMRPWFILSLVATAVCAAVRFSLQLIGVNHTYLKRTYSKSNQDMRPLLLRISRRWKEMRLSYYSKRGVDGSPATITALVRDQDQSRSDMPSRTKRQSMQTWQNGTVRVSHFVRCTWWSDNPALYVRPRQINDPEAGNYRACKGYKKWIEERSRWVEESHAQLTRNLCGTMKKERSRQLHRLCDVCDYFCYSLTEQLPTVAIFEHVSGPNELRKSSRSGCHLCAILWSLLNDAEQEELLTGDFSSSSDPAEHMIVANGMYPQRRLNYSRVLQHCIQLATVSTGAYRVIVPLYGNQRVPRRWPYHLKSPPERSFYKSPKRPLLAPLFISSSDSRMPHRQLDKDGAKPMLPFPPSNTGDDSTKDLILKTFKSDALRVEPPWLPARLLEVRDLSATGKVRLCYREELKDKAACAYVALSHCWGTKPFLTLNHETHAEFERGISTSLLTKTFREAIEMTHRLGFHFIWIDSLCILQGVTDEWQKEAHAMGQTYRSAALTIVAVASKDGSEGLFRDVDVLAMTNCLLSPTLNRQLDPKNLWRQGEDVAEDILRSKWHHRGWTLQEQLLSQRLVYFGRQGVYLKESGIDSHIPVSAYYSQFDTERFDRLPKAGPSWHEKWWLLVADFTSRQLTNSEDRGMAILGLADHFAANSGCGYVEGLWEKYILSGLLWYVQTGHGEHRAKPYRAPTWSWVSVEGSVYNDSSDILGSNAGVKLTEISPVDRLHSLDQLSAGKAKYLELHGKIQSCMWAREMTGNDFHYLARGQLNGYVFNYRDQLHLANVPTASIYDVGPRCYPMFWKEGDSKPVGWFLPDTADLSSIPHELHCLCINAEPAGDRWAEDFTRAYATRGLVLERFQVHDGERHSSERSLNDLTPTFKRIGYFELESEGKAAILTRYPRNTEPLTLKQAPAQLWGRLRDNWKEPLKVERIPPLTDPRGFFADCKPQTLRLY